MNVILRLSVPLLLLSIATSRERTPERAVESRQTQEHPATPGIETRKEAMLDEGNNAAGGDRKGGEGAGGAATEIATFGAGCFWCTEAVLERIDGVIDVTSGYMGGTVKNPSYGQVCAGDTGHAEVVQVTFDP